MDIKIEIDSLKRPSLNIDLVDSFTFNPDCHSYLGGMPFDKEEHLCDLCHERLDFIFQLYMPSIKEDAPHKLYSVFYCHNCQCSSGSQGKNGFFVSKIENPDFSKLTIDHFSRSPHTYAYFDFNFKWQLPDWEYLHLISTNTKVKYTNTYMNNASEIYMSHAEELCGRAFEESFNYVGGFPKFLEEPIIPYCDSSCRLRYELFSQLESNPHLNLNFINNGCFYIFKCPQEDKFKFFIQ